MSKEPNIYAFAFPADWGNAHEVKLRISEASSRALSAIPADEENIQRGIIAFDSISRSYWAIRHFPCFVDAFDCCCAAQACRVDGPDSKMEWPPIEFPEEEECECHRY
jgi:hypothetical protein